MLIFESFKFKTWKHCENFAYGAGSEYYKHWAYKHDINNKKDVKED